MNERKEGKPENPVVTNERALVGIRLIAPDEVSKVIADVGLSAANFSDALTRRAWKMLDAIEAEGKPIAESTYRGREVTDADLKLLTDCAERLNTIHHHATMIKDATAKRRALRLIGAADGAEALRLACEKISAGLPERKHDDGSLPPIIAADNFTDKLIEKPQEVIAGVLYRSGKMVYGGPSKAYKSWGLIDLAVAVATGGDWMGFDCSAGNVLLINLELIRYSIQHRIIAIAKARNTAVPPSLRLWNLRGHACPLDRLLPDLLRQIKDDVYSLIIVDPIYKTLAGREENDTGAIGEVCNEIEQVAVQTGAAVAFGSHFAKGNAASKTAMDRISGSGVFARDPDAILTATPHDTDRAFTLDMTLRDFPPHDPFVIRWEYPQMVRDDDLNPAELKQAKGGRPSAYSSQDVMAHIGTAPISANDWERLCAEDSGISHGSFYALKRKVERDGLVEKVGKNWRATTRYGQ